MIKRNNGTYYAVWRNSRGKQIWKSLRTKNKATATQLFNRLKKMFLQGKLVELGEKGKTVNISDYYNEYIKHMEATKEYNTVESARYVLEKFIAFFGKTTQLRSINAKKIDEYVLYRLKMVKKVTVNKDLRTLRAFFNKAIEWEYIKKNPINSKKFLKEDEKPKRYLTQDEISKILNGTNDKKFKTFITFLLLTGCRRNEALNLHWKDIDFKNNTITIKKTKTHHIRKIPIPDELVALLKDYRKDYPSLGKVFEYQDRYVSRKFHNYVKNLGIECRLHDLRHTFATLLVNSNIQIRIVQDLLGHRDIKSTMVYAHAQEDAKADAVNKISNQLKLVK